MRKIILIAFSTIHISTYAGSQTVLGGGENSQQETVKPDGGGENSQHEKIKLNGGGESS